MMRQIGQLWAGTALLWALLALPAWLLGGETGLLDAAVACGLCLVPMTATMLWCHWAFSGAPEQQLAAVMGGTSVRMLGVVGASIGLFFTVEALGRPAFLIWVVVFYLTTLALEVVLVVRRQNALIAAGVPRPEQPRA
jgi:hypothetical protein